MHTFIYSRVFGAFCLLLVAAWPLWAEPTPAEVLDMFSSGAEAESNQPLPPELPVSSSTEPSSPEPQGPFFGPTSESGRAFLSVYIPYTRVVETEVQERLAEMKRTPSYEKLSAMRRKVVQAHSKTYKQAMKLANAHILDFETRLGEQVDSTKTSLFIQKSTFLVFLMDDTENRAFAAFPIAYGVHPDRGPKSDRGDLRTPESPAGEQTAVTTPFFAHPLVSDDPAPDNGCIERGIGVSSSDSRFDFLDDGWTVMLHGTPDRWCLGTRASHGCIRLLPEHIRVMFNHVRDGTKIVITP